MDFSVDPSDLRGHGRMTKAAEYVDEGKALKGYRRDQGGTVVPKRTPGGGSPMVDPKLGLGQFVVHDITEDDDGNAVTVTYQPGELDPFGNPIEPKETPCPTPSPDPKTKSAPASPRLTSPVAPKTASGTPTSPSAPTTSRPKPTRKDSSASPLPETLTMTLSSIEQSLSSLLERVPLPTSAPSTPDPSLSSPAVTPDKARQLKLRGAFGTFSGEVLSVELIDEEVLVLGFDPEKPYFIPQGIDPVGVSIDNGTELPYHPRFSFTATFGGRRYCVALLVAATPA